MNGDERKMGLAARGCSGGGMRGVRLMSPLGYRTLVELMGGSIAR